MRIELGGKRTDGSIAEQKRLATGGERGYGLKFKTHFTAVIRSQPMNPTKHHYIPAFYTKRWTHNGELCEFQKHNNRVKPKRKNPAATGWVHRLYEIKGYPDETAQQIETKFFRIVDDQASKCLERMEAEGNRIEWTTKLKSSWTRFMLSLILRCPEDINELEKQIFSEYRKTDTYFEEKYSELIRDMKQYGDTSSLPESLHDYLKDVSNSRISFFMFKVMRSLIDNPVIGTRINNMRWSIETTPESCPELITSDRPIVMTGPLESDTSSIVVAIGPHKVFIARNQKLPTEILLRESKKQFVLNYNRSVVGAAMKYVYATDDTKLSFVQKHFGKNRTPGLIQKLGYQLNRADR